MKRIWRNKEGVSPVIATILMVAITVVLAAVLYVMVSGYMDTGAGNQVAGDLSVDTQGTDLDQGEATLTLTISTPGEPDIDQIDVKLFDGNTQWTNYTATWYHFASDAGDEFVKTGDKLEIVMDDTVDIDGFNVVISIENFSGTVEQEL